MTSVQQATTQERTLDELLNIGHNPFETRMGPIPETIGGIRADGREFAGGNIVHRLRLEALQSGDRDRIMQAVGNKHYDLADASITFEDLLKLQPDSHLLKGIRGVVETQDGLYVAIDANSVNAALKNEGMKYFTVRGSETVNYRTKEGELKQETALDVVLLPYNRNSVKFTPDQFRAINATELRRKDLACDRDLAQEEIVRDGKVVHPAWAIYPAEIIAPLVAETFKFNKREWDYDKNMGFFLPGEPTDNAEMRALYVGRLWGMSWLDGWGGLGKDRSHLVGAGGKYAAGAPQKLAPGEIDLLTAARRKDSVLHIAGESYVKTAVPVQPKQ